MRGRRKSKATVGVVSPGIAEADELTNVEGNALRVAVQNRGEEASQEYSIAVAELDESRSWYPDNGVDLQLETLMRIERHLAGISEALATNDRSTMGRTVLTVQETAEVLRVSVDAIYEMCPRPDFPAKKVGGQWRISVAGLLSWVGPAASIQAPNDKWFPHGPLE